jgi:putative nucleotidyltransferase with HDIG domain
MSAYAEAIALAELSGERPVLIEALRRKAAIHHRQGDAESALQFCERSYDEAVAMGDRVLAGEALNGLGEFRLAAGQLDQARTILGDALRVAQADPAVLGRIHRTLGALAAIEGRRSEATEHYRLSLTAFDQAGDQGGAALGCYHVGLDASQRDDFMEAEDALCRSAVLAAQVEDVHLEGRCWLALAGVSLRKQQYADALKRAEAALGIFAQLDCLIGKADSNRVIGMIFRDSGYTLLAEARLGAAAETAAQASSPLGEAEASRELALLQHALGRPREALSLLARAHDLLSHLPARSELGDIGARQRELLATMLEVGLQWGRSIEAAEPFFRGHSERVAEYAVTVAGALGYPEAELTLVRLGGYLHDIGKARVPHEVLTKPARLTREEFSLMRQHPVHGAEMIGVMTAPWEVEPMIRWHHEHCDGSGYPDRLRGDAIPVAAQLIGIADVYDALTTARSYRSAMPRDLALAEMERCRDWWSPEVYQAFTGTLGADRIESELIAAA